MNPVRNVEQLVRSRHYRRPRRPMSQGGMVALAIVAAAAVIMAVIIGVQVRREHREDTALSQAERIMEQAFPADMPPEAVPMRPAAGKAFAMGSYNELRTQMRYRDACAILGCNGEELSRNTVSIDVPTSDSAGNSRTTRKTIESVVYRWQNQDGSQITAIFQDDSMIAKSQTGLWP